MIKSREKIENSLNVRRSEKGILRLFRPNRDFQASLASIKRTDQEDAYDDSPKEIRSAILEAEYKKATAIMEQQKHRYFY